MDTDRGDSELGRVLAREHAADGVMTEDLNTAVRHSAAMTHLRFDSYARSSPRPSPGRTGRLGSRPGIHSQKETTMIRVAARMTAALAVVIGLAAGTIALYLS